MDNTVFLYWTGYEYKLIKILRNLIYLHSQNGSKYKVVLLTPENIREYISDLPDIFNSLIPAHQADIARVFAIEKYGGVWLDSDTLVMNDMSELFRIVNEKDGFFILEDNSFLCNGVFGSKAKTPMMIQWKKRIIDIINIKKGNYGWCDFGSSILKGIHNNDINIMNNYHIFSGVNDLYPIGWRESESFFIKSPFDDYKKALRKFQPLIILVNSVYKSVDERDVEDIININSPLRYFLHKSMSKNTIIITSNDNFGDAISHLLYTKLSLSNIEKTDITDNTDCYLSTGSVLRLCKNNHVVMGAGFIHKDDDVGKGDWDGYTNKVYTKPKKILSVRGPLSRRKLIDMGIECPEIYGDPVTIFPIVYLPSMSNKYTIGLIPHYVDKNNNNYLNFKNNISKRYSIKEINIMTGKDYKSIINDVCECEYIISSSLHGVILGIAYKKKTIFTEFSSNVIGNKFKFFDFFESLGIKYDVPGYNDPDILNKSISVNNDNLYKLGIDIINVCPFIENERKKYISVIWKNFIFN